MAELVANCPRCGAAHTTFDVLASIFRGQNYGWEWRYETFVQCRNCRQGIIFRLRQQSHETAPRVREKGPHGLTGNINGDLAVDGYVNLSDRATTQPPDHLSDDIRGAFEEGAKCAAIGCYNAAGAMYRLSIDLATARLLPSDKEEVQGLNAKVRRDLGLRLVWLFKTGGLPAALQELSTCIKEDGNDGAHAGNLTKEDIDDMEDFTVALLERLFTEPANLKLTAERRALRRQKPSEGAS